MQSGANYAPNVVSLCHSTTTDGVEVTSDEIDRGACGADVRMALFYLSAVIMTETDASLVGATW